MLFFIILSPSLGQFYMCVNIYIYIFLDYFWVNLLCLIRHNYHHNMGCFDFNNLNNLEKRLNFYVHHQNFDFIIWITVKNVKRLDFYVKQGKTWCVCVYINNWSFFFSVYTKSIFINWNVEMWSINPSSSIDFFFFLNQH